MCPHMFENLSISKVNDMISLVRLLKSLASSVLPPQFLFANTLRPSTLLAAAANHNGQGSMTTIFSE